MTDFRARVIEIAKAEIGPQGKGSLKVEAYWRATLPPSWTDAQVHLYAKTREWCGGFALWCLKQAGLARDIFWQDGLGFLGKLPRTLTPSRGDIGYKQSPFQHHLLFDYEHDGWIMSVDGNQPDVREQRRRKQGLTFYSIEPLIRALDTEPAPAPTEPTLPAVPRRTLRWSMNGEDVRELQGLLNQFGHALVCDGNFGRITEAAVKSFQRRAGLEPDGVCGPKTWKALLA